VILYSLNVTHRLDIAEYPSLAGGRMASTLTVSLSLVKNAALLCRTLATMAKTTSTISGTKQQTACPERHRFLIRCL
jgi:hypothetical protein